MISAVVAGYALDLLLGDPVIPHLPHPVVRMGRAISRLEGVLRSRFPPTPAGEEAAGALLAAALPLGTLLLSGGACRLARKVHPALEFALQCFWCWRTLALEDLSREGRKVYQALTEGTLEEARAAVSRIVGRDTASLDRQGVTRAAIESMAENFSDGVAAPLFCLLLGGAPLGLAYKAVNTLDSMVGYREERWLHFGHAAARLDDAVNFLPSRLAALLWICACPLTGQDGAGAWRIWRRDRNRHPSPNSAQCESACAGGLGVSLGGPASYFGQVHDRPALGDPLRPLEPEDILRTDRTLHTAGFLALAGGTGLRLFLEVIPT